MKDTEARKATLANKQAIEHFFETEQAFIDKFAEFEGKLENLSGRLTSINALVGYLVSGVFQDPEGARETLAMGLVALMRTHTQVLEQIKAGQSSLTIEFLDGSFSVLKSVNELVQQSRNHDDPGKEGK